MNSGVAPLIPMVDQIREGLDVHGIVEILKEDRVNWQPIFTPSDTFSIDGDTFLDNVIPMYSDAGSNKYEKEINTYKAFSDCVQSMAHDCEYFSVLTYASYAPLAPFFVALPPFCLFTGKLRVRLPLTVLD